MQGRLSVLAGALKGTQVEPPIRVDDELGQAVGGLSIEPPELFGTALSIFF
jgi:hypothetical protein